MIRDFISAGLGRINGIDGIGLTGRAHFMPPAVLTGDTGSHPMRRFLCFQSTGGLQDASLGSGTFVSRASVLEYDGPPPLHIANPKLRQKFQNMTGAYNVSGNGAAFYAGLWRAAKVAE